MSFLLTIHSLVRWLIVLLALTAIVKLALGWRKGQAFDKMAAGLVSGYTGLLDLQLLLGLMYFLLTGFGGLGFPAYRWEHFITMTVAIVIAHLSAIWKKADDQTRYRNTLLVVLLSLLIIFVGIIPIGGWARWWHITGLF
jgi:hypothetical protein